MSEKTLGTRLRRLVKSRLENDFSAGYNLVPRAFALTAAKSPGGIYLTKRFDWLALKQKNASIPINFRFSRYQQCYANYSVFNLFRKINFMKILIRVVLTTLN